MKCVIEDHAWMWLKIEVESGGGRMKFRDGCGVLIGLWCWFHSWVSTAELNGQCWMWDGMRLLSFNNENWEFRSFVQYCRKIKCLEWIGFSVCESEKSMYVFESCQSWMHVSFGHDTLECRNGCAFQHLSEDVIYDSIQLFLYRVHTFLLQQVGCIAWKLLDTLRMTELCLQEVR